MLVDSSLGTNLTLTLYHGQLSNKKIGSSFIRAQKCGRQPFLRKNDHLLATITKEQTCFLSVLLMNCNHFDGCCAYFCHLFAKACEYNKIHFIVPTIYFMPWERLHCNIHMCGNDKCFWKNVLNIGI